MGSITLFIIIPLVASVLIPFAGAKGKGVIAAVSVCLISVLSSIPALRSITGTNFQYLFSGSLITGAIPVRIDALSGWFMLLINFTFVTGVFYGMHYLKEYHHNKNRLSLHWIAFIVAHAGLLSVCAVQNSLAFLIIWEIMVMATFVLIIFEHHKQETLKAGINYLIHSHVSILLLMLGFIWVTIKVHSFDFSALRDFSEQEPLLSSAGLLLCFFAGFAIKAGIVPFHSWLPYAHPAAPAHISGVMSGVIIKIGIFGMLRMILLITTDYTSIGFVILCFGLISGIYGVMLAIVQHNLKKLLAYHSIENIGIIAIGIGVGCIGMGTGNEVITTLSFAGVLLHTLNHSLFKSLLFYGAGNVYQTTHTVHMEHLGGLGKRMPHTSLLFLVAALAICGLPPLNGFISEFLIYNGMFAGLKEAALSSLWLFIFTIFGLSLIGGMAVFCFTKAYGMVFLGTPRQVPAQGPAEAGILALVPMYSVMLLIVAIGVFPGFFVRALHEPVLLFLNKISLPIGYSVSFPLDALGKIGLCALAFFALVGSIYAMRSRISQRKLQSTLPTWGCGYTASTNKMQYTASSYARAFRKLAGSLLIVEKKKTEITGIFPGEGKHETHPYDKAELWLIDYPLRWVHAFFNRFSFLQNGSLQGYIIYGVLFISMILIIPELFNKLTALLHFLNNI